jgi:hypothetical protein
LLAQTPAFVKSRLHGISLRLQIEYLTTPLKQSSAFGRRSTGNHAGCINHIA